MSHQLVYSSPAKSKSPIRVESQFINQSPNHRSYLSSSRMNAKSQPDSKDLVIAQLKREIMELKISDNDYNNINSQLGNLERRYTQLKQEKNENEVEFSKKTEHQMKTLASLKTEIDSHFSQIGEKENEFRGLLEDYENLEGLFVSKEDVLENQKVECNDLENRNRKAEEEVVVLKRQYDKLNSEKAELESNIHRISSSLEEMVGQSQQIESNIGLLEERDLEKRMVIEENRAIIEEVKRENENLLYLFREKESENDGLLKSINDVENEISNFEREKEMLKNESNKMNALYNKDVEENRLLEKAINDLQHQIKNKDKNLESKVNNSIDLNDKISFLKNSNNISEGDNSLLKDQIRHTINLNKEILEEINKFVDADAKARQLLDRRDQYAELMERSNHIIKN